MPHSLRFLLFFLLFSAVSFGQLFDRSIFNSPTEYSISVMTNADGTFLVNESYRGIEILKFDSRGADGYQGNNKSQKDGCL